MASDAELLEGIDRLNGNLDNVRDAIKWRTVALLVIAAVLTISVIVGGWAVYTLRQDSNERHEQQERAYHSACIQHNVQRVTARIGSIEVSVASVVALADDPDNLTPEQKVIRDRVVERASVAAEKAFPFRDCSPEGIEKYLSDPPPDPAKN